MQNHRWLRTPDGTAPRISFGADYNPDQWPREVWDDDVRLMKKAGVDVVSVAIFSWAKLQPNADTWDFAWLDELIDLMHDNGIGVDLATATASPPPWLTMAHPEVLPVTAEGNTLSQGARQHWRPTSPVFRRHALTLVEKLAERYGSHPGIVAWHVNNELGCHNAYDYSDDAARAFRAWLAARYDTIEGLNHAWGTAFWSQAYGSFEEVLPPRLAASFPNPTQQLDFLRFSSDALTDHLVAEREILTRITPDIPVTTNFMIVGDTRHADYAAMAREIDFVSNDHYVTQDRDELAFSAAITSGVARHRPWFLMEHSTSAVNWQPVNRPKRSGELVRDSLTHVAHGADAVCYFQWRQSEAGAEKYHSAMVPHGGEDTRLFRDVVGLGGILQGLGDVVGSDREPAEVAILFDWHSWWGSELDSHPTELLRYRREALEWWTALVDAGVRVDVVPTDADLAGYRMVVAPVLYSVPAALRDRLEAYATGGGHLVTTYFSGIVDENDHVWLGGYPGAFRELLGVRVEEFRPLYEGEGVALSNGASGSVWSEPVDVVADDVEILASYEHDELGAAVTRRPVGSGSAAYVSTRLGVVGLARLVPELLAGAGVAPELPEPLRGSVELASRRGAAGRFDFYINRTDEPVSLDGVAGAFLHGSAELAARGVAVVRA
ncbi:beta-galactosidase [Microbacterium karelineae]|uniref:beta-galactosidase n=1 Tax=Microbacterium karelineae TaxID=2654283 RepID=UPI0012E9DEBE|nr:beta-galactosidase [Microbacterium karelineae]